MAKLIPKPIKAKREKVQQTVTPMKKKKDDKPVGPGWKSLSDKEK